MANNDCPNGFMAIGSLDGGLPQEFLGWVQSGANPIKIGDPLFVTGGFIRIADANDGALIGMSNSVVPTDLCAIQKIYFYGSPNTMFSGQCSGAYTQAMQFDICDIEGSTGIFEVDENASSQGVLQIIGLATYDDNDYGTNAKVKVIIKEHQLSIE